MALHHMFCYPGNIELGRFGWMWRAWGVKVVPDEIIKVTRVYIYSKAEMDLTSRFNILPLFTAAAAAPAPLLTGTPVRYLPASRAAAGSRG